MFVQIGDFGDDFLRMQRCQGGHPECQSVGSDARTDGGRHPPGPGATQFVQVHNAAALKQAEVNHRPGTELQFVQHRRGSRAEADVCGFVHPPGLRPTAPGALTEAVATGAVTDPSQPHQLVENSVCRRTRQTGPHRDLIESEDCGVIGERVDDGGESLQHRGRGISECGGHRRSCRTDENSFYLTVAVLIMAMQAGWRGRRSRAAAMSRRSHLRGLSGAGKQQGSSLKSFRKRLQGK